MWEDIINYASGLRHSLKEEWIKGINPVEYDNINIIWGKSVQVILQFGKIFPFSLGLDFIISINYCFGEVCVNVSLIQ